MYAGQVRNTGRGAGGGQCRQRWPTVGRGATHRWEAWHARELWMWSGDPLHSSSASLPLLTAFCFATLEDTGPVSAASHAWPLIAEGGSVRGVAAGVCFHCRKGRSKAKKDKEKSRSRRLSGPPPFKGVGTAACRRTSHTLGRTGARPRGLRQVGISCWRQSKQSPSLAQGSQQSAKPGSPVPLAAICF